MTLQDEPNAALTRSCDRCILFLIGLSIVGAFVTLNMGSCSDTRKAAIRTAEVRRMTPEGEGRRCLIDVHATFRPLGTFRDAPVMGYVRRQWWEGQCEDGALLILTEAELTRWRADYAQEQALRQEYDRLKASATP